MGFRIKDSQIITDPETGNIKITKMYGREYATIYLPSNLNFKGFADTDGNPVYQVAPLEQGGNVSITTFVELSKIINDTFKENFKYVNIKEGEDVFPYINIDRGVTGEVLANGKNKHERISLKAVPSSLVVDGIKGKDWLHFTIAKGQKGADYTTKDGKERTTILLPQSEKNAFGDGSRITVSLSCIKEIPNYDYLLAVSVPVGANFTVQTPVIIGQNENGENNYGDPILSDPVPATEIVSYFKKDEEVEQELETDEVSEEETIDIMEDDIQF